MNTRPLAIVTGASRGIGAAVALRLSKAGYNLALCCQSKEAQLKAVAAQCESQGSDVITKLVNVSDQNQVNLFIEEALTRFGHIYLLVNNAGISIVGLFQDLSAEEFNRITDVNLKSVYNCIHAVLPSMIHEHSGRIINISSVWGNVGASCEAAYSATKGGINSLTRALGKELAPSRIAVNAIACGAIDTDMNKCFTEEDLETLAEEIPYGRMGKAEEVAEVLLKLSEMPDYLTGQILTLDGGWI
jgi:3-oxoacyl-[acyl-carrier protein] reductase